MDGPVFIGITAAGATWPMVQRLRIIPGTDKPSPSINWRRRPNSPIGAPGRSAQRRQAATTAGYTKRLDHRLRAMAERFQITRPSSVATAVATVPDRRYLNRTVVN